MSSSDIPQGNPTGNDYVSRPGHKQDPIPVQKDGAPAESDNSQQYSSKLTRANGNIGEDRVPVDKSNVIDKTRHAAKSAETYREPGDTEGLPEDNGRSAIAQ